MKGVASNLTQEVTVPGESGIEASVPLLRRTCPVNLPRSSVGRGVEGRLEPVPPSQPGGGVAGIFPYNFPQRVCGSSYPLCIGSVARLVQFPLACMSVGESLGDLDSPPA